MSTLEEIQHSIKPELEMLHRRISSSLSSPNQLMNQVIEGYLKSKGKMIRPILVILTAKLFGRVDDRVIASAAAVEMLHNASLIHDDVVDDSQMRRSMPTVNNIWGNHIAVLTGDFFVSSALQQAISTADIRIVEVLAGLGKLLSLGEIDQIYNARFHTLNEKAYFEIISRKTASLFVSCVKMGGYATGAPDDKIDPMCRFAELLGLCFQIKDDIFDYFNDPRIGKPTGNDLREGKITLPLLYALSLTDNPAHDEMVSLSRSEQLTTAEIETLIEFAKESGGIEYAYSTMERLRAEAMEILDSYPRSEVTDAFASIFNYVISRDK
ncbi:MAG: polyprenyl synthetase family protein [Bacteroides sp.]|nr:polyprenyl synthetase family protein [Bacteroides sp.]MBD5349931.1 polyprenyl synthetase family protein [Bacteroides sp.]MBD5422863.1 polyprenyl synthetase family protein [Bacteroides sp.]